MVVPASLTASTPRIRRSKQAKPETDGLLSELGGGLASGLQYAGESLNKLSRATWGSANYLAGGDSGGGLLNLIPFSDTMGLTNPRKGIELSGFLENQGVLPKNKAGFDWYDPVRLGADIGGDLTTYLGGIGLLKSFGKGGSILSKVSKDAGKLSRVGRMTTTVGQLASKLPAEALQTAATRSGFADTAAFLSKHGDEAVGGLASLNKPFGGPVAALGTGKTAQKVGGALDAVGGSLRYGKIPGTQFSPGQQLSRVFSPDAMGLHTPEIAKRTTDLPGQREAIITGKRGQIAKDVSELARHGALDDETSMFGRAYGENVLDIDKLPVEQQAKARLAAKITDPWKKQLDDSFIKARTLGIRVERHGDPSGGGYLPRFFVEKLSNASSTMAREDYLVGIKGMTEQLRKAIADPKILEGEFDDAVAYVRESYPAVSEMPQAEIVRRGGEVVGSQIDQAKWQEGLAKSRQNAEELVHHIRDVYTPEQRAVGGFGRNWLVDIQDATIGMDWKATRATAMLDSLKDIAKPTREIATQGETRTVGEVLESAGLDAVANVTRPHPVSGTSEEVGAGALRYLAGKLGTSTKDADLAALAARRLPAAEADDLVRLMKGDDIKNVVGPLMQLFDAASNFFKVSVLNWPSRYSRDFTSSQAMNMLTGNFSPRAATEIHKMLAGGAGDFTHVPVVQQMLAEQGLEATAENSTEIMRQLFYTYEKHTAVAGTHGTSEIVGELSGGLPGGTKGFAAEFPGRDPISPLSPSTLNAGAPARSLAAWNPLNVRGVGGNLTSGFKPAAAGERLGRYTDTMGRGVAFVTNLEKGVAPEQASRIADALQVNYSPRSFTAAERKYFKRAFPFYSFVSRMLPEVTKQLLEHPGGGIAQSIRASNNLRGDEPVPDYVGKGLSIPLGETPTGDNSYLTALDLMHESPLNVAQFKGGMPDVPGTLRNIGGMLNPYPKGLAELAFGKTLFQNRELEDADPTIGRLLTNVGLRDEAASGRAKPFLGTGFEQLAANSPASRLLSSLRTATDPRKGAGVKALNLLTGAKISDISPAAQDAMLRDQLAELTRAEGGKAFESVRFDKAQIAEAEKRDPAVADRMRALNSAAAELARRAKVRKSKTARVSR